VPDRISEPWGSRAPYGPGRQWPVRVDQHLADGVDEADLERWAQSASVLHSNGDGIDIAVKGGRMVGVRGRACDRVNRGRLDPKDVYGWQANASPDRLTTPLVRERGELVETDWDTAMGRIVERSRELLEQPGGWGRIGFYTSGQLFLEEYYTLAVIGRAGIGTPHIDGNTRLCTATAAAALKASFGSDGQPGSYTDIDPATRWRCSVTTSPRPKRCCGCGFSTAAAGRIRRDSSQWTPAIHRWRAKPTCTSRRGAARTSTRGPRRDAPLSSTRRPPRCGWS
jgi:ferredoxin-nitrate reductase